MCVEFVVLCRPLIVLQYILTPSHKCSVQLQSVAKKQTVQIAGFGKFEAVEVGSRVYTNPQDPNNKEAKISKPPTTRAKFFPGKHFKDCVAGIVVAEKKTKQTSETV